MNNREKIRLVAFDLDGTTLHGHAGLSARNRQAMEKAGEAGVLLVPATGRVKNFIPPCLLELPFIRYAITSNGGAVWDLHEDRLVCANLIPTETALAVQRVFDDYELYVEYYVNGRGVTRRDNPDKAKTVFGFPEDKFYFITKDYTFTDSLSDYLVQTGAQPEKINMMFIPEQTRPEILARLRRLDGIELTYSNVDNIEINAKGCNKGTGLTMLCAALGLDPAAAMAVGDNGNDLGMLRAAGFAAVVGNGIEAAKAEADAIVAPCLEDGFAEALERFVLRS
ncbi:MAG: HAD family hydrolase [Hominenteromicrobium sp.]